MYHRAWKNWGDHPIVVIIFLVGTLTTIYTFITGKTNICDSIKINKIQQYCAANGIVKVRDSQEKFVNLRSQPQVNSSVLRKLPNGTPLKVIKTVSGGRYKLNKSYQGNDWYEVTINNQRGYIIIDAVDVDK